MIANSHKTAIARKTFPAPVRRLAQRGKLTGRVLDYGCGKCEQLNAQYGIYSYDPHYQPVFPVGEFDTILCTYVLNTIPEYEDRARILRDIRSRLADGGKAYITVRRDLACDGWTRKGTWQGIIEYKDLPIVSRTYGYVTYLLEK